jgi:hypothetical protein
LGGGTVSGLGGLGGGGNGTGDGSTSAFPGANNTGGGGGGGTFNTNGGNGGSGIIVIAYLDTYNDLTSADVGLTINGSAGNTTPDTSSRSGYKLYTITAGTGNITFG